MQKKYSETFNYHFKFVCIDVCNDSKVKAKKCLYNKMLFKSVQWRRMQKQLDSWPWENLSTVPYCYANGHCVFLCISIVHSTLMVWQGFSCGSPSHVNVMIPQTHSHTHISHCHWNCTFNKLTMHCLCLTTSEMTLNYIITLDYRENELITRLREGSTWMIMHDTKGSRRIVMTSSTFKPLISDNLSHNWT